MDIAELINHPEKLDRDTLYELRSMLALYPYFQTARLLMLQNLYLLHDPTFDEELRRAAIYISDRKVIFRMVEAAHYRLTSKRTTGKEETTSARTDGNRTISLIDSFLDSIPKEEEKDGKKKRKPTPADAAVDYVAYLLETESDEGPDAEATAPQLKGHSLIDSFIENDKGKIVLSENPLFVPQIDETEKEDGKSGDESYFTETLARIYIKQGRYSKALEIIRRLSLNYPKKNAYFADQIRFLEKLIINNNKKIK
ncbi:MAG: tetratricopeptide repeat protein [Prevotella sp.]|nr:tetratricopeptide repeat protein [Prevotella sp.]MDO4934109.1 tetratricopeptide repeat protein [Prevotella sp.]